MRGALGGHIPNPAFFRLFLPRPPLPAPLQVKGSGIGGIEATQAVIDLCAKHNIRPDIKLIAPEEMNATYEALDQANQSGVRFVLDISKLTAESAAKCARVPPPRLSKQPAMSFGAIVYAIFGLLCCCGWRRR